jgi:hypothetical protein
VVLILVYYWILEAAYFQKKPAIIDYARIPEQIYNSLFEIIKYMLIHTPISSEKDKTTIDCQTSTDKITIDFQTLAVDISTDKITIAKAQPIQPANGSAGRCMHHFVGSSHCSPPSPGEHRTSGDQVAP